MSLARIEAAAAAAHEAWRQLQSVPAEHPTWCELLAQGHQGRRWVAETRAMVEAALTAA